jgi:hypothetical protein
MTPRSGKIQFLFWDFVFAVMIYLWIVSVGLQTFVLPDEPPMEFPSDVVGLLFVLFGLLVVSTVAGNVVAMMIGNRRYIRLFGGLTIMVFGTMIAAKGMFG